MEISKLILLLCCTCYTFASHYSHTIPVDGYETELQDLGQHVEIPETPVKVIKITKTVAVKVPVPYPVKVREKVPYPVHVAKPYPVPVPQIIKVPHIVSPKSSHEHDAGEGGHGSFQNNNSYQVQESGDLGGHESFGGGAPGGKNFEGDYSSYEGSPSSYDAPAGNYFGYASNDGHESIESQNYDQALKDYFSRQQPHGNIGGSGGYHYH